MKKLLLLLLLTNISCNYLFSQNVIVRIKLAAINDALIYDKPTVPDNYQEYVWSVGIDIDNNSSTGWLGAEVQLALSHFKFPGSTAVTGTMMSSNQCGTWIYASSGGTSTFGHTLTCLIDYSDTSIVMQGLSSWAELSAINSNSTFYAATSSYDTINYFFDNTSSGSIPQTIYDPKNDVVHDYLDIKKVTISYPGIIGINENIANATKLLFAPNPLNDKSKIMIMGGSAVENYSLIIYNSNGQEIRKMNNIQQGADVYFEKENLSPGFYFYTLIGESTILDKGKIIIE